MSNPYGDLSQGQGHGQPQYGSPPPPPGWGQYAPPPPPQYGAQPQYGAPPGPGYVSYGQGAAPPYAYQPPGYYQPNELGALEDDAQLWLLVTAAGFWVGFGWITGPLGWYFGSKIRSKYRALGHHPCTSANWAWGLGIAVTMIYWLMIVGVVALLFSFAS